MKFNKVIRRSDFEKILSQDDQNKRHIEDLKDIRKRLKKLIAEKRRVLFRKSETPYHEKLMKLKRKTVSAHNEYRIALGRYEAASRELSVIIEELKEQDRILKQNLDKAIESTTMDIARAENKITVYQESLFKKVYSEKRRQLINEIRKEKYYNPDDDPE